MRWKFWKKKKSRAEQIEEAFDTCDTSSAEGDAIEEQKERERKKEFARRVRCVRAYDQYVWSEAPFKEVFAIKLCGGDVIYTDEEPVDKSGLIKVNAYRMYFFGPSENAYGAFSRMNRELLYEYYVRTDVAIFNVSAFISARKEYIRVADKPLEGLPDEVWEKEEEE